MSAFWWLPFGTVPEITAVDLKTRLDRREPVQLIDVRTPGEFASGGMIARQRAKFLTTKK